MKDKIKKWLLSVIGILTIATILIIGAHSYVANTQKDMDKQNKQYLSELAYQNAYTLKSSVDTETDNLASLANIIGSQETLTIEYTMEILREEVQRGKFKRLGFINLEGTAITTDHKTFDARDREYYQKSLKGENCISDIIKDKIDGGNINVYSVPLYYDDNIEGVIFATSDTTLFSDVLNISSFDGEGYSYIIKEDGTPVVFGSSNKNMMTFQNLFEEMKKNGAEQSAVEKMQMDIQKNDNGIIEYERDQIVRIGAYCKMNINDWYVVSVVPRHVILKDSDRLVLRTRISALFIILLLILLVCFIVVQNQKNRRNLEKLAYVDPLTGGNNLNIFKYLAKQIIAQKTDDLYMVRIDIDNFKFINDMYGYAEGDQILLDMNSLISEILIEEEVFGRIGNDNYFCLLKRANLQDVLGMGTLFRTEFKTLLQKKGKRYTVNFTTGVYKIPTDEDDIEKMIDRATMAHRRAKLLPTDRKFVIYDDEIRKEAVNVKDIEDVMNRALHNREFIVYLQPKYNIYDGRIVGAEALIRWKRNGRIIPPSEFLPIFEKNGFIINIDMFVLEEVCKMQREWLDSGLKPVPISINQSKALVYGTDYIENLSGIISKYDLPSRLIELELLESIIHDNINELKQIISQLMNLGFLICIDDFGSGYSSLNLLKDIGADILKIDREFLSSAENNERAQVVLNHIINLADGLKMSTVVEGVETENQAELLRKLKCSYAQGYLYARPMPKEDYEKKLMNENL